MNKIKEATKRLEKTHVGLETAICKGCVQAMKAAGIIVVVGRMGTFDLYPRPWGGKV